MEKLADISAFENLNNSSVCGVWNDWKSDIAGGARQLGSGLWGGALAGAKKVDDLTGRARRLGQRISRGVGAGIKAFREEPNNPDNETRMWRALREECKRRSEECKRRSTKNQRTTKRVRNSWRDDFVAPLSRVISDISNSPIGRATGRGFKQLSTGIQEGIQEGIQGFGNGVRRVKRQQRIEKLVENIQTAVYELAVEWDFSNRAIFRIVREALPRTWSQL